MPALRFIVTSIYPVHTPTDEAPMTIRSQTPPIRRVIRPQEEITTQSIWDLLLAISVNIHSVTWRTALFTFYNKTNQGIHAPPKGVRMKFKNLFAIGICIHLKTWTLKTFESEKSESACIHWIPHVNIHIFCKAMNIFRHSMLKIEHCWNRALFSLTKKTRRYLPSCDSDFGIWGELDTTCKSNTQKAQFPPFPTPATTFPLVSPTDNSFRLHMESSSLLRLDFITPLFLPV